ncbi:MAG: sigma-70 family RNA polymerase sigma factor [Planctomycetes bacterium]|nr:sigma-70 family RNA polymerase sigma factor [Planctomycetota bacterium]
MNDADPVPQPRARFDTTQWSVILRARDASVDETREAVSHLAQAYWYPLYVFSRRQGNNEHDAMDLTQGFFVHVLNGRILENVSPEKGRFRSFLLAAFRNFMANQRRASGAERRGGGTTILSLDAEDVASRYAREPSHDETPEVSYHRNWAEALLVNVRRKLADDYHKAGKSELFALLEPHLTGQGDAESRTRIGRKFQLSVGAVNMSIHRLRRRFGELLRQEVAATVVDPADVDDELLWLMNAVGRAANHRA